MLERVRAQAVDVVSHHIACTHHCKEVYQGQRRSKNQCRRGVESWLRRWRRSDDQWTKAAPAVRKCKHKHWV